MAFTGAPPIVTLVADNLVRLSNDARGETAFGLASGASGTIGLFGSGANVELPEGFMPKVYEHVSLQASIQVELVQVGFGGVLAVPVKVVKTGTTHADFLATLTNDSGDEADVLLEIYVRFH